jgi:hypothetical protein
MLSRLHPRARQSSWRKEFREGRLKPSRLTPAKPRASKAPLVRELRL